MARLGLGKLPELVRRLDEFIFNHNGKALENYQGAKHMLSLSILSAILSASILAGIGKFSPGYFCFATGIFNEIFHIDHVFALPGFFRKFFYPFFVAIISAIFLAVLIVGIYLTVQLFLFGIALIIVFFFFMVSIKSNIHTPPSSIGRVIETVRLEDGTELKRHDGDPMGMWRDGRGKPYEEIGFGSGRFKER